MASLEGGLGGLAAASGMSAQLMALLTLATNGDHLVSSNSLYGGTYTQFNVTFRRMGIEVDFVDPADIEAFDRAIRPNTKAIFAEVIGNPGGTICDIAALAEIAHAHGIPLVVDNTFATPYLCRPIQWGADIVVHSATKFINGHSDMVGGVVVVTEDDLAQRMAFLQNSVGGIAGPFDAFLAMRGLKTLHLRMQAHCANALALAQWLERNDTLQRVIYPGLKSHPQHALAKRQMHGFGGLITIEVKGGLKRARTVLERCKLFSLAESLGGVESLIELPAIMTHASLPPANRRRLGISDGLIRLSVGVEDLADLQHELAAVLA
jgi:cystathionine gamma-lyase